MDVSLQRDIHFLFTLSPFPANDCTSTTYTYVLHGMDGRTYALGQAKDVCAVVYDLVTMGDEDHRVMREPCGKAIHESILGLRIQSRTEFIEKKYGSGAKKRPGYSYTLSLPL